MATEPTAPTMTTDWVATHVAPGTREADDPTVLVPAGWYVLGGVDSHGEGQDVAVHVVAAFDVDGNDACEYVAKLIAEQMEGETARRELEQARAEVKRLTAENAKERERGDHYLEIRLAADEVLDGELGTEEEDGAGEGFVADVALVVQRLNEARAEITQLRHALSVAEQHEADVRLEVEREVRDEAAEAGA